MKSGRAAVEVITSRRAEALLALEALSVFDKYSHEKV